MAQGPDRAAVGRRIRQARERSGLSQGALGDATGVRGQTVWRYEKGMLLPSADALDSLARALGVASRWLLWGDEAPAARVEPVDLPPIFAAFYQVAPDTTDDEKRRLEDRRWRDGLELTLEDLFAFRGMIRNAARRGLPPLSEREQEAERSRIAKGRPRGVLVPIPDDPPPVPKPARSPKPNRTRRSTGKTKR